ncbi:hypothetical protein [Viscerimonas tarda]
MFVAGIAAVELEGVVGDGLLAPGIVAGSKYFSAIAFGELYYAAQMVFVNTSLKNAFLFC